MAPADQNDGWDRDAVILGRDDVSDFNGENILPLPEEELAKIRAWLKPTNYDHEGGEFKRHQASHLAGTGGWLFASDAYRQWHSSKDKGLLWIRGIPGSGKSVFAASIVDRLRQEGHPVLYFFFRQIIDANHSPVAALRDWLDQLLLFSPPLQVALKEYIDEKRDRESLSSADLWRHIRQATIYLPKVYCVVDALDEMDQTKDLEPFLHSLAELAEWQPSKVKLVATSRPVSYLERSLRTARALHIRLEERQVDADIATYVQHSLSRSGIPAPMQAKIRAAVPGRANGLFLYAKLAMEAFLRPGADVASIFERLPQDLNVMYGDLLQQEAGRNSISPDIQLLVLQAVTHASRPLRLLEVADFIDATQHESGARDLKAAKDLVRKVCGSLLEILPDETVSVVHHSLTEFLRGSTRQFTPSSYPILETGPTHERLSLLCLSYLLSDTLDKIQVNEPKNQYQHLPPRVSVEGGSESLALSARVDGKTSVYLAFPFLEYAANNWHVHARKSAATGHSPSRVNNMIDRLFEAQNLRKWTLLASGVGDSGSFSQECFTPLMTAVKLGLIEYVRVLLGSPETEGQLNINNVGTGSPLCVAAREGYEEIVALLLKAGADKIVTVKRGYTPLLLAASNNRAGAAKILVEAGDDPLREVSIDNGCVDAMRHPWQESAVSAACRNGHMDVLAVFMPYVKTTEDANKLLQEAVTWRRPEIVEFALQHPLVDVNSRLSLSGTTVLVTACAQRNPRVIQLLLQAGANPNACSSAKPDSGWEGNMRNMKDSPLQALMQADSHHSREGSSVEQTIECLELLLGSGADASKLDSRGNSLLHYVTDPVAARLLLDAGASLNSTNKEGETVLHTCNNEAVLQVLLADAKTDLEQKTKEGLTPLLHVLKHNKISIAFQLLEVGASAFAVNKELDGVFHFVVRLWHTDTAALERIPHLIRRLRDCGADPSVPNRAGDTPLHVLVGLGNVSRGAGEVILRCLAEVGADLEARDHQGRTPFFKLATCKSSGLDRIWDAMLELGAKLDTVDFKGQSLFYQKNSSNSSMDFTNFTKHGLDPKRTDNDGNSLWHVWLPRLASRGYGIMWQSGDHPECVRALVGLGIDILQRNHNCRTPLHQLCMYADGSLNYDVDWRSERTNRPPPTQRWRNLLEYVVGQYSAHGVDQTDRDGVTALHFAATHCEFTVRTLLHAGASPSKATLEGLTPLHLAARSRQPNIVAMLLEWMKSRYTKSDFLEAVNSSSHGWEAYTPLHFACASGCSASVQYLLEAGAVDNPRDGYTFRNISVWHLAAQFEEEEANWPQGRYSTSSWSDSPSAESVRLEGTHRRRKDWYQPLPKERLEEIIDLLAKHNPPTLERLDGAIDAAANRNSDYTVDCLTRARAALFPGAEEMTNLSVKLCLARRDANREVIRGGSAHFSRAVKMKDYDLATEIISKPGGLGVDEHGYNTLHDLITSGFASILKKIATKELIDKFDDWELRSKFRRQNRGGSTSAPNDPLLIVACQQAQPNMDVICVLVEDIGVNINVTTTSESPIYGSNNQPVEDQTALHILCHGRHRWQSALALPYFIEKGADLNTRDGAGLTPLLTALGQIPQLSFNTRAVETLVAHGADVNVVDPRGDSCLARAVGDINVVSYLLENGAIVTNSVFTAAIRDRAPGVLKAILARGGDPSIRQTAEERLHAEELSKKSPLTMSHTRPRSNEEELELADLYPIDFAVCSTSGYDQASVDSHKEMIQILFDHGANPNVAYPKTTVMHRVIAQGRFVRMFLGYPSLNLEARASNGHTLLLAACASGSKAENGHNSAQGLPHPVEILLDLGADVYARGNDGSTALHLLVDRYQNTGEETDSLLRRISLAAPELVNARDEAGQTPLHLVSSRCVSHAIALISLGADPKLPDSDGNTPLHLLMRSTWSIDKNNELHCKVSDLFSKLVEAGVDVNARNLAGETPLFTFVRNGAVHYDAMYRNWEDMRNARRDPNRTVSDAAIWELFVRVGMDWNAVNNDGETLLHAAVTHHARAAHCFTRLMERGLDPLAEDSRHRTPLDVAAVVGAKNVLALFKREEGQAPGKVHHGDRE
ncbi:hypothetical protein OQA88_9316 [Cercophora sp. LCS_1]